MGAQSGQKKQRSAGTKRRSLGRKPLTLAAFVALFVALFVGFAIAEGIGQPSVPSGDVATVKSVPDDISNVSEAEFKGAVARQVAAGELKKTPKPGSKKYEELKAAALGELLDIIWITGEAEELDLSVTDKQVETALDEIKKTNFPTEAKYQEFLKTSHYTQEDVDKRVELQKLSELIQETISTGAPTVSSSEIADYYDAVKATQFTTKPSRDVRLIINEDEAQVEAALKLLEADDSPASWKEVAAKYSSDPTTKSNGGLQAGLTEELLQSAGPLKKAIFDAATGELIGPIKFQANYVVLEVEKLNPEKVKTLAEVRSEVSSQLSEKAQQEFFSEFVAEYQSKWESRTFCASGFVVERCANYKGSGHPSTASAACYEANPKAPAKECPAPVALNTPALPGSVSLLEPTGKRLPQRPRHAGEEKASGEEGATSLEATEAPSPTGE